MPASSPFEFIVVGVFPPPVTGMSSVTGAMAEAVDDVVPVVRYDLSDGSKKVDRSFRVRKFLRLLASAGKLLSGRRARRSVLYMPVNTPRSVAYNVLLAGLARIRGHRVVAHHHIYAYIDKYDWRVKLLVRVMGQRSTHVVHCQQMEDDFLAVYPTQAEFLHVPPNIVSPARVRESENPRAETGSAHEGSFRLGFMSNLTVAKGLVTVLETFGRLVDAGSNVRLLLAGPCWSTHEQEIVDAAVAESDGRIEYLGPVYGDDKTAFFSRLDAFLFPTQFKNESWGIVLTEALAFSLPVIAYGRGCVPWIVRDGCGLVVPQDEDFVKPACELVQRWIENPDDYRAASEAAARRDETLEQEALEGLQRFRERLQEWSQASGSSA